MGNSLLDYLSAAREDRSINRQEIDDAPRRAEPPRAETLEQSFIPQTVTLDKVAHFMELDLSRVFVWLKARLKLAALFALVGAVAGAGYGIFSPARYTVSSEVLINPSNLQVLNNDPLAPTGQVDGQLLGLGSRVRILTSVNVLARTVTALKLDEDPEFYKPPSDGWFSSSKGVAVAQGDPKLAAVKTLRSKIGVSTDEKSFVATLAVSAETAQKAIQISNAIVDAFRSELADADSDGARHAAVSLDQRLARLKDDVMAAEERVEAYKRANNLSVGENGQLVSSQTVSQLNSQIALARARAIDAEVIFNSLKTTENAPPSAQTSISPALAELLKRVGIMQQQFEDQRIIFGERHPSIIRLKAQLSSMRDQVNMELARARNVAKSDLDNANAALAELNSKMAELQGSAFNAGESQVELRELQRDATAKASIYESFLSRARQMTEREQINSTNVRVISTALPPGGRSWPPRTIFLLVAGAVAGLIIGMVLALALGMLADLRHPPRNPTDR